MHKRLRVRAATVPTDTSQDQPDHHPGKRGQIARRKRPSGELRQLCPDHLPGAPLFSTGKNHQRKRRTLHARLVALLCKRRNRIQRWQPWKLEHQPVPGRCAVPGGQGQDGIALPKMQVQAISMVIILAWTTLANRNKKRPSAAMAHRLFAFWRFDVRAPAPKKHRPARSET